MKNDSYRDNGYLYNINVAVLWYTFFQITKKMFIIMFLIWWWMRYYSAVLENHHAAMGFMLTRQSDDANILKNLDR